MKVWRLESEDGKGVYKCEVVADITEFYQKPDEHPIPNNDSLLIKQIDSEIRYLFGFSCPKQLFRWFYDEQDLISLGKRGIVVSIYAVNGVVGHTQACFPRDEQTEDNLIIRFSVPEFLNRFGSQKLLTRDKKITTL